MPAPAEVEDGDAGIDRFLEAVDEIHGQHRRELLGRQGVLPADPIDLQREDPGRLRHFEAAHLGDLLRRLSHAIRMDAKRLREQAGCKQLGLRLVAAVGAVGFQSRPDPIAVLAVGDEGLLARAHRAEIERLAVHYGCDRSLDIG